MSQSGMDEIRNEMLSRVNTFFGDEGSKKIQDAFIIVVGLGGVGSHAVNMLARSGVKHLRIIDFDQVTLSSLNRHAVATMDDVGRSKASVMKKYLQKVIPWCNIEAVAEMFRGCDADRLLAGNPTYVLDCIDDISTKAELISYCDAHHLKLLASLGAGGKADPTRLRIAPLSDCINDPLAAKMKWKLKKHGIAAETVMSVFSIEKPICNLLPLDEEQKAAPQDYGTVDYLRLRVMPVLGTSPSIFGQAMASYTLCQIAGAEYVPEACERLSKNLKHKLREALRRSEHLRQPAVVAGADAGRPTADAEVDIDDEDVEFIVQILWSGRCAITQKRFGGHAPLVLTRWNAKQPPVPHNLVLMIQTQANLLLDNKSIGEDGLPVCFPPDVTCFITQRLAWGRALLADEGDASRSHALSPAADCTGLNGTRQAKRGAGNSARRWGAGLELRLSLSFAEAVGCIALVLTAGFLLGRVR